MDLISVVLGAPSDEARFADNLELLEYGFSQYRRRVPIHAGQDLADPRIRYTGGELPLRAARSVAVGLRRGQRLEVGSDAPSEVEGPLRPGPRSAPPRSSSTAAPPARCRCGPGARSRRRATSTGLGHFVEDNPIPIAIAVFVILIGGVLLYRRLSGRNDQGERTGVKAK